MKSFLKKSMSLAKTQTARGGGPKTGVTYPHSFTALNSFFNDGFKNHPAELYLSLIIHSISCIFFLNLRIVIAITWDLDSKHQSPMEKWDNYLIGTNPTLSIILETVGCS